MLTPTVEFSAILNGERKEGVDLKFNYDARIEFFLDQYSLPSGLIPSSDLCLGQVQETSWACLTNVWTETSDGFKSFPITSAGKYALIVNPDPNLIPPDALCNWWCQYQLWVYIGGGSLIAVILIGIFVVICCKSRKTTSAATVENTAPLNPAVEPKQNEDRL